MSEITWTTVEELEEAPENPRRISDEAFERLCRSMDADPAMLKARPLIVDVDNAQVVAGNMRLRAAKALLEREPGNFTEWYHANGGIPVYDKHFESPAERREWLLRDNSLYGEWVPEEVAALIAMHRDEGGIAELLGFSDTEADALLVHLASGEPAAPAGTGDVDATPKSVPDEPFTRLGDLWELGDHALLCGDAVSFAAVQHAVDVGEHMIHAVWTDPPYGVNYDAEARVGTFFSEERLAAAFGQIKGDEDRDHAAYAVWLAQALEAARDVLIPGGAVYLCHAGKMMEGAAAAWRLAGLHLAQQLVWVKSRLTFGRLDYHYSHEPIIYGWLPGGPHRWFGDRTQCSVIEVPTDHYATDGRESYAHPTQKPYGLIAPCIENSTQPGEGVLDPFAGAGSTLIACEHLGRRCVAIEIEPRYCDVILDRWAAFTGRDPVLRERGTDPAEFDPPHEDGHTWSELRP